MKDNIVLIGMPGVGKSTVGVILAKMIGYQFTDADLLIQKQEGKLLHEIIAEKKTESFIKNKKRVKDPRVLPNLKKRSLVQLTDSILT